MRLLYGYFLEIENLQDAISNENFKELWKLQFYLCDGISLRDVERNAKKVY